MGVGCSSFFACPGQQPRSSAPHRNRLTSHSSGRLRRRLIQALERPKSMLSITTITLTVLVALLATWRYAVRAEPVSGSIGRLRFVACIIIFSPLAFYSFYLLYSADATGMFACSSTRCGSSDAHLATGPLRYWMLYCMYWFLGLVSTFLGASAAVVAVKRSGKSL